MKTKIESMVEMQDTMNSLVNPDWKDLNWAWYRAAYMECAELIEHVGWKWWKKQTPNIDQIHLELVDVFHFIISDLVIRTDKQSAVKFIYEDFNKEIPLHVKDDILFNTESMIRYCLQYEATSVEIFAKMCNDFDLSFDGLYEMYIMKNILNIFRQQHGYKTGEYIKDWSLAPLSNTLEDNEYLTCLDVDWSDPGAIDKVKQELESRYSLVVKFNEDEYGIPH